MFGCIVAGRLDIQVQTNLQTLSNTQFVFTIDRAETIGHLVVFLTGQLALPPCTIAIVHYNTDTGMATGSPWIKLGYLSNEKASAIFKVSGMESAKVIQIGISIESDNGLLEQSESNAMIPKKTIVDGKADLSNLALKVAENLYNYIQSFVPVSENSSSPIPISIIKQWYENFSRKIIANPNSLYT